MALTDEIKFFAKAGRGGDGVVRWRREKYKPKGGPNGGDGGNGGDFYVEGIRDVTVLYKLSRKDTYGAENGGHGGKNSMHGANGDDFILGLPIGSVVTNTDTGEVHELLHEGQKILLLKGGEGGYGNEHFKSSTNQTPMQATKGKVGEEGNYHVELRLIADVGFVGLPNAGKTSLLNALTNAGARVGDYPFTTLDPNLGVYHKYILADIPGIIEGASQGKGLGYKFLRHISRTSVILHCISLERDTVVNDYNTIRKELSQFDGISNKNEYVVLTKSDMVMDSTAHSIREKLIKEAKVTVLGTVTILDDASVKNFGDSLTEVLRAVHTD